MIYVFIILLIITAVLALYLALVRFFFNRLGEAERQYRKGEIKKSIEVLKKLLDQQPDNDDARWFLASLLYEAGDYSDAVAYAKPLVVKPPKGVSLVAVVSFLTRTLMLLGREAEAMAMLKDLGELMPGERAILELLAEAAERSGVIPEAIRAYEQLEDVERLEPALSFRFGKLLLRSGQAEKSLPRLKAAWDALSDRPEIGEEYADALCQVWKYEEANEIYRRIFETARERRKVLLGRKYAEVLEELGSVKTAIDVLNEAAAVPEATPRETAEMLYIAGDLLLSIEKRELADATWRRVLELVPDHPGALKRLGIHQRPADRSQLIALVRSFDNEQFKKLFEKILVGWGYTVVKVLEVGREQVRFAVTRYEYGKDRQKLVSVDRWENEAGELPLKDLKLEILEKNWDGGVFITMGSFTPSALIFAGRSRMLELFSATELVPLLKDINLEDL